MMSNAFKIRFSMLAMLIFVTCIAFFCVWNLVPSDKVKRFAMHGPNEFVYAYGFPLTLAHYSGELDDRGTIMPDAAAVKLHPWTVSANVMFAIIFAAACALAAPKLAAALARYGDYRREMKMLDRLLRE